MAKQPARVFICYRRDDSAGYAGRLEESLERVLGRDTVFRDIADIAPGEDYARVIRARLADASGVLVLIGARWTGPPGTRRLDDEHDFVRLEVQEALASGARVVPVLLPGATMPTEAELPDPLKPLARRNALPLDDLHWQAAGRTHAVLRAPRRQPAPAVRLPAPPRHAGRPGRPHP
jgi:hypothetical protein